MSYLRNSIIVIGLYLLAADVALSASRTVPPSYVTGSTIYTEPSPPQLDAAGSKNTDWIFRRQIIRLTDSNDSSTDCLSPYSNIPLFNVDNTYVFAMCTVGYGRFKVWDWNSTTNTATNGRIQANPVAGYQDYQAHWSRIYPDKVYACAGRAIYQVTIPSGSSTTWVNTLVKDLSASIGGAGTDYCEQLSVSYDDDVFAMHYSVGGTIIGYLVYKRSTNTVLLNVSNEGTINEVEIDKSGKFLVVRLTAGGVNVWDLRGAPVETAVTNEVWNHRGLGFGTSVSSCLTRALCIRNLATPNTVTKILPDESWSYAVQGDHFSLVGMTDAWMLSCRYSANNENVTSAYDQECVQVATDGSQTVRRLLHHHANVFANDYDAQPHASMSMDGRYFGFSSNWEGADTSARNDVYIVDLSVNTQNARTRTNATTRSAASSRASRQ